MVDQTFGVEAEFVAEMAFTDAGEHVLEIAQVEEKATFAGEVLFAVEAEPGFGVDAVGGGAAEAAFGGGHLFFFVAGSAFLDVTYFFVFLHGFLGLEHFGADIAFYQFFGKVSLNVPLHAI